MKLNRCVAAMGSRPPVRILHFLVFILLAAGMAIVLPSVPPAGANTNQGLKLGPSGLPLPRFVSLKSGRVNMRVGPGDQYAVEWLYMKAGLPMEIIQEYDNWRRVRDADGAEGWIFHALLSGRRTGIVAPWFRGKQSAVPLRARPRSDARAVGQVEPGAVGEVVQCNGEWCRMTFAGHTGWMKQTSVWGVYPNETIEE